MTELHILQVSDLHLGEGNWRPGQRDASFECRQALQSAFQQYRLLLRSAGYPHQGLRYCVVAGDLTVSGGKESILEAIDFLCGERHGLPEGRAPLPDGLGMDRTGTETSPANCSMVAGNHDHWAEQTRTVQLPAFDPNVAEWLPSGEWRTVQARDDSFAVEIFTLDTSRGYGSLDDETARRQGGRLDPAELERMKEWNSPSGLPAVRVVLAHHDLGPDTKVRRPPWPIYEPDRTRLMRYMDDLGVAVVLTGHQHRSSTSPQRSKNGAITVEERRSGTACYGDPKAGKQRFFVHRVALCDGGERAGWTTYEFAMGAKGRFRLPKIDPVQLTVRVHRP